MRTSFPIFNATNRGNYITKKASFAFKCHSRVFYSITHAEVDRVLLDRHKEEFQRVVVECISRCLD